VAALIAAVAVAIVGLGLFAGRTCGCSPTLPPAVTSPVDGVVVFVDSASLTDIRGFRLRLANGSILDFKLGPLENATEFSPSHLAEHMATGAPLPPSFSPDRRSSHPAPTT